MLFRRIAMVVPNFKNIYAPSRIDTSFHEFDLSQMEQLHKSRKARKFYSTQRIKVSFDSDGISNPQTCTAYAFNGLDVYYIAAQL